jgi:hypothetical protein
VCLEVVEDECDGLNMTENRTKYAAINAEDGEFRYCLKING